MCSSDLGGIALINSIGSFSGLVAPYAVGRLKDMTGKTSTGLYVVAGLEVIAAVLILLFMPRSARSMERRKSTVPETQEHNKSGSRR